MGGEWEGEVLKLLNSIGYTAEKYSDKRIFSEIKLPEQALNSLPGGSLHNPDIIVKEPLLLVDAKKDANKEMHKIQAYDIYALHPKVDGNALIATETIMQKRLAERISHLKRTSVIDRYALETIAKNPKLFKINAVSRIFGVERKNGGYVSEDLLFDNLRQIKMAIK
jgi:hypothetical protein